MLTVIVPCFDGEEKTTLKELSETLEKETMNLSNFIRNKEVIKSFGLNYQRNNMSSRQDEIAVYGRW